MYAHIYLQIYMYIYVCDRERKRERIFYTLMCENNKIMSYFWLLKIRSTVKYVSLVLTPSLPKSKTSSN